MNELARLKNGSIGSRFRCAIAVGLTSFASIAGDWNHVDAAWWPFPLSRKSADDSPSKSDSGFNGTIRKLLKEAKAQEELGNFDKSELPWRIGPRRVLNPRRQSWKPALMLSPNATAHYARELRLKKAEQSLRQNDGKIDCRNVWPKGPYRIGAQNPATRNQIRQSQKIVF